MNGNNATAIIVAAGDGSRFGTTVPKPYVALLGQPVLAHCLRAFVASDRIERIIVVVRAQDGSLYEAATRWVDSEKIEPPVVGGSTRQKSVLAGLEAAARLSPKIVLIHDGARPIVTPALVARAVDAAIQSGAAVPVVPIADTVIEADSDRLAQSIPRDRLRRVQTPQSFRLTPLLDAHRSADHANQQFTDDGTLMASTGAQVTLFDGEPTNLKITHPDDLVEAERLLGGAQAAVTRVAQGFDVHAFGPGDHVWLGGIRITHGRSLIGHSDADVVLHALTDALLGTIADGDIGSHFPPSDARWKGASSDQFIRFAADRVRQQGGVIDFLDVVIACESPAIAPHRDAMREQIAALCDLAVGQIAVKATTTERLGFLGRREGIAAWATATVRLAAPLTTNPRVS